MARQREQLAAREHSFTYKPADPERFFELLIELAGDAVDDRNWRTAYNIASGRSTMSCPGAIANQRSLFVTITRSLAWLAGTVALDRMQQPVRARS